MPESVDSRLLFEEAERRRLLREAATARTAKIKEELFDRQVAFVDDRSKRKGALCTRRAGKTSMWSRYGTVVALENSRVIIRIWAATRLRAKQLLWDEFNYLHARHGIVTTTNETELSIRFANGSEIRLLGADKDRDIQKKRGDKTILEIVLEAQLFPTTLRTLVEDVAGPSLFDLNGTLCLEGTPGAICAGFWFNVSGEETNESRWVSSGKFVQGEVIGRGWSMHHWSLTNNPMVDRWRGKPNWEEIAQQALLDKQKEMGWASDNPTYIREYLGRWVNDVGALYYKFNGERNTYDPGTTTPWGVGWEHVLGWDLGFRDAMALVVWGWHPSNDKLYEAFSWKKQGALAQDVMNEIEELEKRGFNFVKKVADTGGGGRMYVEEVMSRYQQSFEAAKKTEKYEHVRLFNDDLLTGKIQLRPGSPLKGDMAVLPIDPNWPDPDKPEAPPREDPHFENHTTDAGLYAYRAAWHYLHEDVKPANLRGSEAWIEEMMDKKRKPQVEWWENPVFSEDNDDYCD